MTNDGNNAGTTLDALRSPERGAKKCKSLDGPIAEGCGEEASGLKFSYLPAIVAALLGAESVRPRSSRNTPSRLALLDRKVSFFRGKGETEAHKIASAAATSLIWQGCIERGKEGQSG
jgi:hypothetical protein